MTSLVEATARARSEREVRALFSALFTTGEVDHFNRRWKAFHLRLRGKSQRDVAKLSKISIQKAQRASQVLKDPRHRKTIERFMLAGKKAS